MKERPILFSTPMVQAILEGRKTQTRRTNGLDVLNHMHYGQLIGEWYLSQNLGCVDGVSKWNIQTDVDDYAIRDFKCPYGKPGDILWVRETIEADEDTSDYIVLSRYKADKKPILYRTDNEYNDTVMHWNYKRSAIPSIHMPKSVCRIFLEITDIRVERLNDISEEDAVNEGVLPVESFDSGAGISSRQFYHNYGKYGYTEVLPKDSFQSLWEKINGPDSWKINPFVWVVSFKKVEK